MVVLSITARRRAKQEAIRRRQIKHLCVIDLVKKKHKNTSTYLRVVEALDPAVEQSKLQTIEYDRFMTEVVAPLHETMKDSFKDRRTAKKHYKEMIHRAAKVRAQELDYLLETCLCYKVFMERVEQASERKAALVKKHADNKSKYEVVIDKLTLKLEHSRKGYWCRNQTTLLEPQRDPRFKPKLAALDGGPMSPPKYRRPKLPPSAKPPHDLAPSYNAQGVTGLIRLLDSVPVPATTASSSALNSTNRAWAV